MVSAKYKQTKDVGTVTLDIAPPILSPNWYIKKSSEVTISELIVDSFKPEENSDIYIYSKLGLNWEDGIPVGYDSSNPDNFKNDVRLFEKDNHDGTYNVYILAIGKNPVIFPENSNSLFAGWKGTNVTEKITFNNIDTSTVNDMQWMFYYCGSLTSLDISSFKTDKVTDMSSMFAGCSSLERLIFGEYFKTGKVTDMNDMFNGCEDLTNLDVSGFDTSQVTNMNQMFNSCKKLTTLDLSNFNTSKVINMSYMFNTCEGLTSLDISRFDTSSVTYMNYMFGSCKSLPNLNLSSFNTTNVTDMNNMFYDCGALTSLNLSNFTTPNLEDMSQMFMLCSNLQSLNLSNFKTLDNTNMSNLFTDCSQLKQVTLGAEFKFINYSADTTVLLPGQKNVDIPGANEKWYISNSSQGYNSTEVAVYHNEHNTITTYYAVQSEAPASVNTFSLLTENGIISGDIQGN